MSRGGALLTPIAVALVLAGCGAGDNDPSPEGMTVGEARALDEAAEMLKERRQPVETPPAPTASPAPQANAQAEPR